MTGDSAAPLPVASLPVESLPVATLPRWLPAVLLSLLVLPLHPYWFDFEQVRRGLLLLLVGAALLWRPLPAALPRGVVWSGALFLGWNALSLTLHLDRGAIDGVLRLCWLFALAAVLRLGAALPRQALLTAVAGLLLLTSLFGLLQRLGLAGFAGYGNVAEPVSVFGNLNVAAEFTAVAAIATLLLWPQRRGFAAAVLLLAGAYLAINGTRSALVALPFGIGWLWWKSPAERRATLFGALAVLLGLLAGLLLARLLPMPTTPEPIAAARPFAQQRYAASLPLRFEIGKSALRMAMDAPLFGKGPGQFQIEYPRYRSQQEIEISSYGRQFATKVGAAHDDWLEVLVEGGLPALLLLLLLGLQLLRGGAPAAPLLAFAVLMLARAPLGNAPAAAVALLLAGSGLAAAAARPQRWHALPLRAAGVLLLAPGAMPILGNCCFIDYQGPRAHNQPGDLDALQRAAWIQPFEPAYQELLAQEFLLRATPDLPRAQRAIDRALLLRPYEPTYHLLAAEIRLGCNDSAGAMAAATAALALDPGNPQALVRLSEVYFCERNPDAAVRIVYQDPHPRLREQLPQHFRSLEQLAQQRGDTAGANRYAAERSLLTLLPLLGKTDAASRARAALLGPAMLRNFAVAGLTKDVRPLAAAALLALDADDPATAQKFAITSVQLGLSFEPWQRALFGEQLARLQSVPEWRTLLTRE